MITVLNFIGISDNHQVAVAANDNLTIKDLKLSINGNTSILEQIKSDRLKIMHRVLGGARQKPSVSLPRADLIVNSICDPDTNTRTLLLLDNFVQKVDAPVINHPSAVLKTTREQIYERFRDQAAIRAPKTIRINPRSSAEVDACLHREGIQPPLIFRKAGEHGGQKMAHIATSEDFGQLEQFAFDGSAYYAIEFIDYQSADGLYRKARLFMIDGKPYPRHLIVSKHWNIHAESRGGLMTDKPVYQQEEQRFIRSVDKRLQPLCQIIYDRLQLDFFGIDCSIDNDGNMIIFEINPCMRPFATNPFAYLDKTTAAITKAIERMIIAKATRATAAVNAPHA